MQETNNLLHEKRNQDSKVECITSSTVLSAKHPRIKENEEVNEIWIKAHELPLQHWSREGCGRLLPQSRGAPQELAIQSPCKSLSAPPNVLQKQRTSPWHEKVSQSQLLHLQEMKHSKNRASSTSVPTHRAQLRAGWDSGVVSMPSLERKHNKSTSTQQVTRRPGRRRTDNKDNFDLGNI